MTSLGLLLVFFVGPLWAASRYDPHLRFRAIRTPHFTILFHQEEEELAARLAIIAEEVHKTLSPRMNSGKERHTRIILVDQHDEANGWATPLPFDTIEISAVSPSPSSAIGNTDDWLRLVFAHEYTHILQLDQSRGLFAGLRRVFGRAPVLFPNMFLPAWDTEGLATFYETEETRLGRLRSGEFRLVVDAAARARRVDPIDRATGALVDWPGGNAGYAYGARFHEYLAQRFGADSFGRLASATAGRVPYFPGGAYKKVFGVSAKELWQDFARALSTESSDGRHRKVALLDGSPPSSQREDESPSARVTRLTRQGFVASGPRWLPDGSLVYSLQTPHEFPSVKMIHPDGSVTRLTDRYRGERLSISGRLLYFDQRELVRNVGLQSDLYVVGLDNRKVRRLTRGARAADPDVSPDGRTLVHIVRESGRAWLALRSIETAGDDIRVGEARVLRDDPETQYGAPRWSADGRLIAAERRRLGARPDVIVLDVDTRAILSSVFSEVGRIGEPEWLTGSDELIVSWEQPNAPFNLCAVPLDGSRGARALLEIADGARAAAVSPARDRIAFVGYTIDGYDIFSTDVPAPGGSDISGVKVEVASGSGSPIEEPDRPRPQSPAASNIHSYSPVGTLLPRFWMPVVETDEDRVEIGAGTAGLDALGRHAFASTVRWADRARPDWDISYVYDRWRASVLLSAADDLTVWQGSDYRETSLDAGLLLPFNTVRRRQSLFAAIHATREEDVAGTFDRRSLRFAYQLATARRYGYSISQQDGILAGFASEITRAALGADADSTTLSTDIRAYPRLGGRHRVLALRAGFAASFGDLTGRKVLGAGGSSAPGTTLTFGRDVIGLARGFATDDIVGYRAAVVNADYRLPLWNVERGIGSLPVFIRQVHAAVFFDAAHAWTRSFQLEEARTSAGVELSSDIVVGHYLPLTFTGGVAFCIDPSGEHEGPTAFWRLGYAF